jgi:hypothetical protein
MAAGMIPPPPSDCIKREKISSTIFDENAQRSEPNVKRNRQIKKVTFLLKMSPSLPAIGIIPVMPS